jgi:adenine-specific DNA-methyltransferase
VRSRKSIQTVASLRTPGRLVDDVELRRLRIGRGLQANRGHPGQYMTPAPVAEFMASLATAPKPHLRILDAGAGVGSLSSALVASLLDREKAPKAIELTAYEVDPALARELRMTVDLLRAECSNRGVVFTGDVRTRDFIADATWQVTGDVESPRLPAFDCAILNPPYKKIRADSAERHYLELTGLQTTNLYTAFLYLSAKLLAQGGELVAITPRSFCNGPYFRAFRESFLGGMRLERLHVYETRDTAFGEDDVLQENVIFRAARTAEPRQSVVISSSASPSDPDLRVRDVPYNQVVDPADRDFFIHIVPDELNGALAGKMRQLPCTLVDLGLSVSTGRVVDFRATEHLRATPGPKTVPLIYPGHLAEGRVRWPRQNFKKSNALADVRATKALTVPTGTYVLVKRFSAKEEPRRVVAAVFQPEDAPASNVGFENHLNYFHADGSGLPSNLARGLAAFLNSTAVDSFFRQFNGHTQVNATDLRSLRYPTRTELESLGRQVAAKVLTQGELDDLVEGGCMAIAKAKAKPDAVKGGKRVQEAIEVLASIGMPRAQQNTRSALTLLSLLDLRPHSRWVDASNPLRGITEMMDYFAQHFGTRYAPNTRETVRRLTIHQFVDAGFVLLNPDLPGRPTNSADTVYQVDAGALEVFRSFDTPAWSRTLAAYLKIAGTLRERYAREREMKKLPITLPSGNTLSLSPGGQNELIKLIVEEFCPRFTPGGSVLYVGDSGDKWAACDESKLAELGVKLNLHGKMPDVVVFHTARNWLILVEAVTTHGPVDAKRRAELQKLFKGSKAGLVYVTAFEDRATMVKYLNEISWETEVWVAVSPSHMIHFNGERFLGPYEE